MISCNKISFSEDLAPNWYYQAVGSLEILRSVRSNPKDLLDFTKVIFAINFRSSERLLEANVNVWSFVQFSIFQSNISNTFEVWRPFFEDSNRIF